VGTASQRTGRVREMLPDDLFLKDARDDPLRNSNVSERRIGE
jgi:hypothetical protein